jgi:tRNA dimethylallyltransferase
MTRPTAILIAGPTASGKSGLALTLAERWNGTVINADSMQVYADLRILTARPSEADLARAPHALYGFVDGAEAYSVGRYVTDAAAAIAAAQDSGRLPILVGGTGLYFKALLEGLSPIPPIPDEIRQRWRGEAKRIGPQRLHALLRERDPATAERLAPSDPQRVTRALEVLEATGRPLSDWQREAGVGILEAEQTLRLVMSPSRDEIYRRCDARFDAMLSSGALAEVRALAARTLDPDLPVMRALGVAPLLGHLVGQASLSDAAERAKAETRQYAKRQITWTKSNMMSWKMINEQHSKMIKEGDFPFIDS